MMGIGKKEERKPAIELGQEISYMERKKKKSSHMETRMASDKQLKKSPKYHKNYLGSGQHLKE